MREKLFVGRHDTFMDIKLALVPHYRVKNFACQPRLVSCLWLVSLHLPQKKDPDFVVALYLRSRAMKPKASTVSALGE